MKDKNLFKSLKESLQQNNIEQSSDLLLAIYDKYGRDWVNCIKLNGILPEPLSHDYSQDIVITFMESIKSIIPRIDVSHIRDIESVSMLLISIMGLHSKIEKIDERLKRSDFFAFSPVKQFQMLAVFIEDQSRIAENLLLKNTQVSNLLSRMDLVKTSIEDKDTKKKNSPVNNIEAMVDIIDIIFRYIFWRYKSVFDGNPVKDISPYNLQCLHEVLVYADIRACINDLWQKVKYRDWILFVKNGMTYYFPPEKDRYIKEEASVIRYSLYLTEILQGVLFFSLTQDEEFISIVENMHIKIGDIPWQPRIDAKQIRQLISLFTHFDINVSELFNELYKRNINDLLFGASDKQVTGQNLLQACKYIYILSYIYQTQSRKTVIFDDETQYFSLIPVLTKSDLVSMFIEATGLSKEKCINALNLLCFNPSNTKIDLWLQPLIPISEDNYLLIPTIGRSMNIIRLFECHISQWNIRLDDRGALFEDEIRNRLKKVGITVVSHAIKFEASDGREVEYDVVTWFKDYLILIEAKCLLTPYSPSDKYNCWQDIKNGIEQLKRRKKLINSDWNKIVEQSEINLPKDPPTEENILCLLVTNVFTFTGLEIDGVRVCDLTCLYKYLSDPIIEARIFDRSKSANQSFEIGRIWKGIEPEPKELWDYVYNPLGLSTIVNRIKVDYTYIPPFNEDDNDVFFYPYIEVEGDTVIYNKSEVE